MPAKLIEFNLVELLDPDIEECSPPDRGIYLNAPSGFSGSTRLVSTPRDNPDLMRQLWDRPPNRAVGQQWRQEQELDFQLPSHESAVSMSDINQLAEQLLDIPVEVVENFLGMTVVFPSSRISWERRQQVDDIIRERTPIGTDIRVALDPRHIVEQPGYRGSETPQRLEPLSPEQYQLSDSWYRNEEPTVVSDENTGELEVSIPLVNNVIRVPVRFAGRNEITNNREAIEELQANLVDGMRGWTGMSDTDETRRQIQAGVINIVQDYCQEQYATQFITPDEFAEAAGEPLPPIDMLIPPIISDPNPTLFIHSAQDPEEAGYQYIQVDPQVNHSGQEFSITATPDTRMTDLMSFSTPGEGERVRIDADGNIHAYGNIILHGEASVIRADEVEPEYRDLSSFFDGSESVSNIPITAHESN